VASRGLTVLGPLTLAILALVSWEGWSATTGSQPPAIGPPAADRAEPVAIAANHPAPATPRPVAAWSRAILARPVFTAGRHPPPPEQRRMASRLPPRLAGTISTEDGVLAIFAPKGAPRQVVAGRDAEVAGWTVASIGDGVATLVRNGRATLLHVSFAEGWVPPPLAPLEAMVVLHDRRSSAFLQP